MIQDIPKRVACLGECMIEISPYMNDLFRMNFAGDTFNTAVYLKRQFPTGLNVEYLTALGDDSYSQRLRHHIEAHGVGTSRIRTIEGGQAGLYMIENDDLGERFFHYWRSRSAARSMLSGRSVNETLDWLGGFDLIYLTGISMAILDPLQQETLLAALYRLPRETVVAFDPNYRELLWPHREEFGQMLKMIAARADIVLSTYSDEHGLFDTNSVPESITRWHDWGVGEVVIKEGADGCYLSDGHGTTHVTPEKVLLPVDTTGAGDSFSGAYLAARLLGQDPLRAAALGNKVAGQVILHQGAILPDNNSEPIQEKGIA